MNQGFTGLGFSSCGRVGSGMVCNQGLATAAEEEGDPQVYVLNPTSLCRGSLLLGLQ